MSLPTPKRTPPAGRRPCWWPAIVFLAMTAGAMVWVRVFWDTQTQDKNVWTFLLSAVCFACLLLWLLVLSRLAWRVRLQVLGVVAVLHVVAFATIRIKGVDGDLFPVLEWRWAKSSSASASVGRQGAGTSAHTDLERIGGWPQFLGADRNCKVPGIILDTNWLASPPEEVWRIAVGSGWSGFAVMAGYAVTQEQDGENETVTCYEARTGRRLWRYAYPAHYSTTIAGEGPRATPTIIGNNVYAVGSTGWMTCLDLATGELIWDRNPLEENDAVVPEWGYSVSPLVIDDTVILSVGGTNQHSLMGFDRLTGEPTWSAGDDRASYSSPVLMSMHGVPHVVVFNYASVVGHNPADGQVLWSASYSPGHVHVAAPLQIDEGRVLFSSGYGHGSELYAVQQTEDGRWTAELIWTSRRMKAKFTNLIEHDGFIYGLDDGIFACLAADTGDLQWKDGRYGHGQAILVESLLLLLSEAGEVVLIQPNPERLIELGRTDVFEGKTWNPPALAGEYLFLRTDREAVCLRLPLKQEPTL